MKLTKKEIEKNKIKKYQKEIYNLKKELYKIYSKKYKYVKIKITYEYLCKNVHHLSLKIITTRMIYFSGYIREKYPKKCLQELIKQTEHLKN
jgi:hypothetical protein